MHVLHSLSSACIAANSTGSHHAFKFPHNIIDKRSDMCFPKAHHSGDVPYNPSRNVLLNRNIVP